MVGTGVLGDLIAGIQSFARLPRPNLFRNWVDPIAIGCVPWLNDDGVVDALARLSGCCIVISKGASDRRAVDRLAESASPVPSHAIPSLAELGTPDAEGRAPMMLPSGPTRDLVVELGPVRVWGYRGMGRAVPLLHAKVLVLGEIHGHEDDEWDWGVHQTFHPVKAWLGSANWTKGSSDSIEIGLWVDEPSLIDRLSKFVCSMIAASEALDSASPLPTPDLVAAEWDDDAFREASAESRWTESVGDGDYSDGSPAL
jgi:hypothetical protein